MKITRITARRTSIASKEAGNQWAECVLRFILYFLQSSKIKASPALVNFLFNDESVNGRNITYIDQFNLIGMCWSLTYECQLRPPFPSISSRMSTRDSNKIEN